MTDTTVRIHLVTRFVTGVGPDGLHGAELPDGLARSDRTPQERTLVAPATTPEHRRPVPRVSAR